MTLRPRNNPGRVLSGISGENRYERLDNESKNDVKPSKAKIYARMAVIALVTLGAFALVFKFGSMRERAIVKQEMEAKAKMAAKKMDLAVHWAGGPVTLSKDGDADADACILLAQCFKSPHFNPDPERFPDNPYKTCHGTLRSILRAFDSGFYFDGPRVVGFISSAFDNYASFSQISLYNVCVRQDYRGKGIAKAMVPEYIKAVMAKRIPKDSPRVYIGLDVDFDTESAVAAFALYAKMGFNRWWEPCSSIARFDFNTMERQLSMANPSDVEAAKPPSFVFPMTQLMLRRKESLKKQIYDAKGNVLHHFCMVMLYGADDFGTVGSDIRDAVQNALKSRTKK